MSRMRKGLGMAWVSLAAFAWASVLTGLWPSGAACAAEEKVVVKGIVVGEDGQPVPGARVRAVVDRRGSAFAADLDVVTDAQGQFEAQLAPGTYRALATKGLLTSHGGPRAAQWWEVRKEEGPMEIRIPLKPGGRIMGVVVKKDGAPIEAARVSMQPVFAARTDKDGRFELEGVAAGKHYVWAQATGFGKEYVEANASGQGTAEVKIELGPEFKVRGRVTDEQGQPVSGARVLEQFVQRATTDADGRYEVRGLSFNRKATSVQVEHPGFAKKQRSDVSPPKEGDVLTLDFVLDKGYTIEGEVRGPDGQPIRGARVGFNPNYLIDVPRNSAETDENGRFQLSRLEREDEGYLVAQAKGYAAAVQSATPGRGEKVPRLSFKLSPGASATGRVVDSEGRPVARAMVVAQLLSTTLMPHRVGLGPYLKTDKDGRFKIDGLPSGHVTVNVWAEGYSTVEERPLKLDAENTIVLDPVGVIIGKVADEITGQPVSEFRVLRTRSSASPWSEPKAVIRGDSRYYDQGGDLFRSNDGTFTLKDLVCRASHAVVVSAPGYAPTHLDPVAAQAPDWKDWPLVIKLNKGATVSGQVLDAESGQPVADAEVCLFAQQLGRPLMGRFSLAAIERPSFYQFTAVRKGRTDQAGRYELPVIPKDGVLYLVARASGYGPSLQQDIEFEKPSVIKLARAGSIAGTAAGVPNLDLKKARVHAEGVGFNFESVKVGDDGAFRLDNLPPGDFWLTLRTDDWKYRRMNRVEVLSGQTTQVDWGRLPSFKLTGTATQAGKPVAGVKVNVNCAEDGHPMGHLATTDAQGRYVFPNLSPGEYLVSTWKGEGWPRSHEAREEIVIRDKDTELNFDFPAARIVGRVLDGATGQPLKDVTVSALRLLPPDAPPERSITLGMMDSGEYVLSISPLGRRKPGQLDLTNVQALAAQRTAGSDFSARTEANGEFEIANLAAGTYLLRLNTPDDSIPIVVHGVVLAHDRETKRVDVQLDRSHVLGLKVIDAETKQPIPNARVHFCTEGGIHLRSALYSRQKAEEDAKLAKAGVRRSASGFVPIQSDANGLIHLDRIQAGQYGVWFIAAGYGARWVSPLPSAPRAESAPPHAISLERTGTLRLKPAPDLLAGVKSPYLAYRIWDSEGRVVCADQEPERYQPPYDTALVKLTDKTATGYAVDILPPGTYTLAWELYRVPSSRAFASDLGLPLFKGKARFEVRRGEQSVVELKGERVSQ